MQAAFADIGLERPGFLHASDISRAFVATANDSVGHKLGIRNLLHDGQELLVQVQRDPMGTKGARLDEPCTCIEILSVDAKGGSSWSVAENNGRKRNASDFLSCCGL